MNTLYWILGIIIVAILGWFAWGALMTPSSTPEPTPKQSPVVVLPIEHATMVLTWASTTIYTDPTDQTKLAGQPPANIVLVTDIHGDHLSSSTLLSVVGTTTTLVVPQAVKELLPESLAERALVLKNGESADVAGISITAVPMYNVPESQESYHPKGRGNGYVLESDGYRVYIAGDSAGTPEMRGMQNIDLAFVPMNLPFTMSVEDAAEAVLAFKPNVVYPYHYRGQDGLADVSKFKQLVNAGDAGIEVVLANWYPTQ